MTKSILLGLLSAFISTSVFATDLPAARKAIYEKQDTCGQAVFSDSEWLVTSLPNAANGIGHIRIQSLTDPNKTIDLPADDTVVDVKIRDGNVYILTETTLEAWNIAAFKFLFKYKTSAAVSKEQSYLEKAMGFVLSGDTAIIAHGVRGLFVIDLKNGEELRRISMLSVSSAQDIDLVDDSTAIVAVDNSAEGQFRGMYVLDLKSLQIKKQVKVDNALPLSIRVLPGNRLMITYINAVWKFDLAKAITSKTATPNRRSWVFPGRPDIDLRGKIFYDEKYLYTCVSAPSSTPGMQSLMQPMPLVMNLVDLKLN